MASLATLRRLTFSFSLAVSVAIGLTVVTPVDAQHQAACDCGESQCNCTQDGSGPGRSGCRSCGERHGHRRHCECCAEPPRRTGGSHRVAFYAKCSVTPAYAGYYVGGGAVPGLGEPRCPDEGTWGMDYAGILFKRRVWLRWWHGKPQGGVGAYKTDGPHFYKALTEKIKH